ncbi:hypothetical protein MMC21_006343 [Puttea exsequens]|nr:hypothetical protein [Puttea exsequens]
MNYPYDFSAHGSWTPIEQETLCSGGGSWSPRTTDSRSDHAAIHTQRQWNDPHGLGISGVPFGGSTDYHTPGGHPQAPTASVISPNELQHYSDEFSEVASPRPDLHGVGAGQAPFQVPEAPYYFDAVPDHFSQDEGLGSSIQNTSQAVSSKAASIKADDELDDDDPEADYEDTINDVDWSPEAEGRGHPTRRSTMIRSPASTPAKRSQRAKTSANFPAKPKGISKKPSKTSTANTASSRNTLPCDHCSMAFPSDSTRNKHVLATHTRPFICTFHAYGCDSVVGSKNEWKRHINVQHMHFETWRCDMGACALVDDEFQTGRSRNSLHLHTPANGNGHENTANAYHDFDRKDLFTQHVKRMHGPANNARRAEKDAFNASIEAAQVRCKMEVRDPPTNTICPFCPSLPPFESWEDRLEHIGKHLEKGEVDVRDEREDEGLRRWMEEQRFVVRTREGWVLVDMGKKKKRRTPAARLDEGWEDAEGEDEL